MQLEITRSQKKGGWAGGEVVFILNVQSHLSEVEIHLVKEYGLGKDLIYNSEAKRKNLDKATSGGMLSRLSGMAMAALSLKITIDSLMKGQSIECKSLDEVLAAEDAVREACESMKAYLAVAQKFDGTTETVEF